MSLATEIRSWLQERGIAVVVANQNSQDSQEDAALFTRQETLAASSDLLVVLGGDGTLLRWSRITAPLSTPMLGINFGQYGFITEVPPDDAIPALTKVLQGNYSISNRLLLKATVMHKERATLENPALNDVVISKGPAARMLALNMSISDKHIVTYMADGIIVSTPTGSTAYSMSAGGPVVHPGVGVMIITPICAHTLSERALVIADTEHIGIAVENTDTDCVAALTIDGQHVRLLEQDEWVSVCKADFEAKLVQIEPLSFYNKLQTRLHWGERFA